MRKRNRDLWQVDYALDEALRRITALEHAMRITAQFIHDELGYEIEHEEWGPGDHVQMPHPKYDSIKKFVKREGDDA